MRLLSLLFLYLIPLGARAGDAFPLLDAAVLDKDAFAQWSAGVESPVAESEAKDGPRSIVWATAGQVDWRGTKFGAGRDAGVRHLRIGFTKPVATGSVLVSGGGALSVLKPDAAYPGDLANDSQWVPAERLLHGLPSRAEVSEGAYALWPGQRDEFRMLPRHRKCRALLAVLPRQPRPIVRFIHELRRHVVARHRLRESLRRDIH